MTLFDTIRHHSRALSEVPRKQRCVQWCIAQALIGRASLMCVFGNTESARALYRLAKPYLPAAIGQSAARPQDTTTAQEAHNAAHA